jgi:hypothetical protein
MTYNSARAATVRRSVSHGLGRSGMALLSLTLVLAPLASHAAAFTANDADVLGNWGGGAKDPTNHYEIVAGPAPSEYQLISPTAEKVPPIVLRRVAADTFASPTGTAPTAKFTLTSARHAKLYIHDNSKKRLTLTYLLLDKQ